ncbi:MAG: IS4/IS5 family transposase [Nitrosomonas sp. PRO4]|nr:IS4/IS5 family transposase [Nitrosomonas sp. PRO4]
MASWLGYKQHTLVDDDDGEIAVGTTVANKHDRRPMLTLLDKVTIKPGARMYGDKAYCSQKHREALKSRGDIKKGIQDKTVKNKPLTQRQLQRNRLITKVRYVVKRTFGSQAPRFISKFMRYLGLVSQSLRLFKR